jgi:hypothetical protein
MSDPIVKFFAEFPRFNFTPSSSDWRQKEAFNALAAQYGWTQEYRIYKYECFKDTWCEIIEEEFEESDLESYQNLCEELGIEPAPESIGECRSELSGIFVNIVDLVQYRKDMRAGENPNAVTLFNNAEELRAYSDTRKKWCPVKTTRSEVLRVLLRPIH